MSSHLHRDKIKHNIVEVPTEQRKKELISSLAKVIYNNKPNKKNLITTKSSFLNHNLFIKYGKDCISDT